MGTLAGVVRSREAEMNAEKPARRQRVATLVADKIANEIIERRLQPGHPLPAEAEMIKRYEVARGTLREALLLLEAEGLILVRAGRFGGPVVQQPSTDRLAHLLSLLLSVSQTSFRSVLEARRLIEPELAALAANRAGEADHDELRKLVSALSEEVDDERRFLEINREFHLVLAGMSGNEPLTASWMAIEHIVDGHQVGVRFSRQARLAGVEAYTAICAAVTDHDGERASALVAKHLEAFAALIARRYPELLDDRIRIVPRGA